MKQASKIDPKTRDSIGFRANDFRDVRMPPKRPGFPTTLGVRLSVEEAATYDRLKQALGLAHADVFRGGVRLIAALAWARAKGHPVTIKVDGQDMELLEMIGLKINDNIDLSGVMGAEETG